MRFSAIAVGILFMVGPLTAGKFQYVGVKKCKICHRSKKIGDQYGIWEKTGHAKAFEALLSDTAKKVAKSMGIDDPTKSEKCLRCHTTGFGAGGYDLKKDSTYNAKFIGVQCEACHGPGSAYRKMNVMKGLANGTIKPEDVGLVMPTEETCKTCHTPEGNPFYKEFKFEERVKKIAHPVPK